MPSVAAEKLPIRTIASLTGVNPITLRAWERRYGLIRPSRTAKGHRMYTHDHVEQIRRVLALVERGVPISRVRELLDDETKASIAARGPWRDYLERMAAPIARFDEAGARPDIRRGAVAPPGRPCHHKTHPSSLGPSRRALEGPSRRHRRGALLRHLHAQQARRTPAASDALRKRTAPGGGLRPGRAARDGASAVRPRSPERRHARRGARRGHSARGRRHGAAPKRQRCDRHFLFDRSGTGASSIGPCRSSPASSACRCSSAAGPQYAIAAPSWRQAPSLSASSWRTACD